MLTAGGVVSALDTVTLTGDEVMRLPAASRATASLNWTPATTRFPMMLTLAVTGIEPETVDPEAGDVMVTIRLPDSCASACCGEIDHAPKSVRRAIARGRYLRTACAHMFVTG